MSFVPPKKGEAYTVYVDLTSSSDHLTAQVNPTLATGDVMISKDGSTFTNLATLPSVVPAGSDQVEVNLSSSEVGTAENITIRFKDAAGGEWDEVRIYLQTVDNQFDDIDAPTAEEIWSNTTRTITGLTIRHQELDEELTQTIVNIRRGDYYEREFISNITLSGYTSAWFTIKGNTDRTETDPSAIIQIKINASGVSDGLLYVNGAPAADESLGELVIDEANDTVTVIIDQQVTASFAPVKNKPFDIQILKDGDTHTIVDGTANIFGDVTRSLT